MIDALTPLIDIDPEQGLVFWKGYKEPIKTQYGSYYAIAYKSKRVFVHRLVWQHVHGRVKYEIDHINGNTLDNRIENLRDVPHHVNLRNRTRNNTNNRSGHRGVHFHKQAKRWYAYISLNSRHVSLGYYSTKEAAIAARIKGENDLWSKN